MPVNREKMAALKALYGDEKGERVYYAMEKKGKKMGPKKKKKTRK